MSRRSWLRERIRRFAELRRALPIVAAGLLVVSVVLPAWRIVLTAPQYRDPLIVDLYAYPRLGGDFEEVQLLNSYVGFHYPDPVLIEPNFAVHEAAIAVPEWTVGPVAFLLMAATGLFVAIAPTERKLKLGLTGQLVGTIVALVGMFAIIQYRLHQAGHSLDPNAPMTGYDGFTPPVLGSYEIANISGYATVGPGGYLVGIAVGLLVVAFLLRNSPATPRDVPAVVRIGIGRLRGKVTTGIDPTEDEEATQP